MRYIYLALALCVLASSPACALTYVSSCGSLSGDTVYQLTADLGSSSTSCLEMTSHTGYIEINCDGHSITMSGSGGFYPLYIHNNNMKLWYHGCTFNKSSSFGFGITSAQVKVADNAGYDPARDGTGTSIWSIGNYYNGGSLYVTNTDYFYSEYDTFTMSALEVYDSDYVLAYGDTVNNTGYSRTYGEFPAGYHFVRSNHVSVQQSSVGGYYGSYANGNNVDDGVLLACDGSGNVQPQLTCTDVWIDGVYVYDVYDAGVEFVGQWTYPYIFNSTFIRPELAGIGCFGAWGCSLDHAYFHDNTATSLTYQTELLSITANSNYGSSISYLTNSTFSNNSIDNTANNSHLGFSSSPFASFSGNTVTGNLFGSSAYVYVQQASGMTDGGGNYCAAAAYAITCH
jgi:hypothetical protein